MQKLSTRLQKVYDLLDSCDCIADIGCDHGYLAIAMVEGGCASRVIAMDVNDGPLNSARANIAERGLSESIDLRLSDGLAQLRAGEAEGICICGMGGLLIRRILANGLDTAHQALFIILEPQSEFALLREFLQESGFVITDEDIATEENKYYPIIKAHYEPETAENIHYSPVELAYGPILLQRKPPLLRDFLEKKQSEFSRILQELEKNRGNSTKNSQICERIRELTGELSLIEEAKNY